MCPMGGWDDGIGEGCGPMGGETEREGVGE